MRRARLALLSVIALSLGLAVPTALHRADAGQDKVVIAATSAKKVGHVFTIMLENSEYEETFVLGLKDAPYLSQTLPKAGALLQFYFGTGHSSLDNYIAMTSGQGPNKATQGDCDDASILGGTGKPKFDAHGQVLGKSGCTYPKEMKSLTDQLDSVHKTWKAYMQGMDSQPTTKRTTCRNPYASVEVPHRAGHPDPRPSYKDKHNPWAYYHSTFDRQAYCDAHVVPMGYLDKSNKPAGQLVQDLKSVSTTAQYTYITPDQCHDAHDSCYGESQLQNADSYLKKWLPVILNSPAFKQDGLLMIAFDEGTTNLKCCGEIKAPNLSATENNGFPIPGSIGDGGGKTGILMLSPFIKGGTTDLLHSFNHYSYLRSMEDLFGVTTGGTDGKGHLGYAADAKLTTFQKAGLIP